VRPPPGAAAACGSSDVETQVYSASALAITRTVMGVAMQNVHPWLEGHPGGARTDMDTDLSVTHARNTVPDELYTV